MFDVNLLGKPGIQPENVPDNVSFYKGEKTQPEKTVNIPKQTAEKSSANIILFIGFIVTIAVSIIFYFTFVQSLKSKDEPKKYHQPMSSEEIFNCLEKITTTQKFNYLKLILVKRSELEIRLIQDNEISEGTILSFEKLTGVPHRIISNLVDENRISFRIPWQLMSRSNSTEISDIAQLLDSSKIIRSSIDSTSNIFHLVIKINYLIDLLESLNTAGMLNLLDIEMQPGLGETMEVTIKKI